MLPAKCAGRMGEQMIKSMTGFGRCEICEDNRKFTVEMKSVNHRYLDVNLKMPKKLNFFEAAIRNLLKEYIQRGKVDVFITYEDLGQEKVSIRYNKDVAAKYLDYLRQMSADFGLEDDTKLSSLARFPEVFSMEEEEPDEEGIWKTLEKALRSAAEGFVTARVREGEALKTDLCAKLDEMKGYVDFIEERSPQIVSEYRQKLTQRVQELLGDVKADESRLLTEVTVYADKICVDEEIVRLQSHISAMKKSLTDGGSIGRKLDFLAQEMNREANTILSKTTDLELSNRVKDADRKGTRADSEYRVKAETGLSQFIHIGFGNIVNTDKIIAVVSPDSAPVKRLVQKARETGNAVDATQGRRTKAVLVMENSQLILSALLPETIAARAQLPQDTQPSAEEEKQDES